jgi:hypothetical protein
LKRQIEIVEEVSGHSAITQAVPRSCLEIPFRAGLLHMLVAARSEHVQGNPSTKSPRLIRKARPIIVEYKKTTAASASYAFQFEEIRIITFHDVCGSLMIDTMKLRKAITAPYLKHARYIE